nr:protein arginine kinase [uncultured Caproiciproducens sp.]
MNNLNGGCEDDVVINTRIHLVRNLRDVPFPAKMSRSDRQKFEQRVVEAVGGNEGLAHLLHFVDMERLSKVEAVSLVERQLISADFISDCRGRGLFVDDDECVSVMINEEDHIHLQSVCAGFNLEKAFQKADELDDILDKILHFAFDENLGYLTQSPVNLGTGMRASLMLHLPALREEGGMSRISTNLSKLGLALRGSFGPGSEPKGAIYQMSNHVTFGLSEQEAIANLQSIAMQLIEQERASRKELAGNLEIQDTVSRSLAILQSARMMANDEFMQLISNVRFGVSTGLIRHIDYDKINRLIVQVQPATLMFNSGKKLTSNERRSLRAQIIRDFCRNCSSGYIFRHLKI